MRLGKRRARTNWLATGEQEIRSQGHLSAATRPQVLNLVLTGDAAVRSRALALLDEEKRVHAGYERLATPAEVTAQAELADLHRKLSAPGPELPPWPEINWRP